MTKLLIGTATTLCGLLIGATLGSEIERKNTNYALEQLNQLRTLSTIGRHAGYDLSGAREIKVSMNTSTGKPMYRIITPRDSTYFLIYHEGELIPVLEKDLKEYMWPLQLHIR